MLTDKKEPTGWVFASDRTVSESSTVRKYRKIPRTNTDLMAGSVPLKEKGADMPPKMRRAP